MSSLCLLQKWCSGKRLFEISNDVPGDVQQWSTCEQVYWCFTCGAICVLLSAWDEVWVCVALLSVSVCWLQPEKSWLFHTHQTDHRCHPAVLPVSTIIAFSYVTSQSQSRWLFLASVFYSEDKPSPHLQLICLPCLSICSHCSHYIHVCQVHSLPFALCLTAQLEHPWHTGTEAQWHHHFHVLPYMDDKHPWQGWSPHWLSATLIAALFSCLLTKISKDNEFLSASPRTIAATLKPSKTLFRKQFLFLLIPVLGPLFRFQNYNTIWFIASTQFVLSPSCTVMWEHSSPSYVI